MADACAAVSRKEATACQMLANVNIRKRKGPEFLRKVFRRRKKRASPCLPLHAILMPACGFWKELRRSLKWGLTTTPGRLPV